MLLMIENKQWLLYLKLFKIIDLKRNQLLNSRSFAILSFVKVRQIKLIVVVVYIRILFFGPRLMYSYFSADFSRGGSRILFRRGCTRLLLYFNTNRPHSLFFFRRIPVVLENRRSSREGGECAPPAPSP